MSWKNTQNRNMDTPLFETQGLSVGYDKCVIIEDINLKVLPGQIVSLVGPNGTGKSTILKTITKAIEAKAGNIRIAGQDMQAIPASEYAKMLSVLLTNRMRTDLLTCRDIVEGGRYPYTGRMGVLSEEDKARVQWVMELIDIADLADCDFMCISDGQRQRVLLARAICQEPEVLVLDEPTTFLDIRYQADLARILRTLAEQQHCCIIASLHELELARKISDVVVCVKDGAVLKTGPAEEVLTRATIQELFNLSDENYRFLFPADYEEKECNTREVQPSQDARAQAAQATEVQAAQVTTEAANASDVTSTSRKQLRCGWTTGTCAAAATRAAAEVLLGKAIPEHVSLTTPSGACAVLEVELLESDSSHAVCSVIKDAGDDPDITDGMPVVSTVRKSATPGISIDGGEGVGRITRPGLDQPIGKAAINSVPRRMIEEQAQAALEQAKCKCGLAVEISLPLGRELAAKTFNPRLGIEGGISVLGTSGVVKPMSEDALIATIETELKMHRAEGEESLLMSPGNYGKDFAADVLGLDVEAAVQCSNYLGKSIDMACDLGFKEILLVSHIGKLIKVAAGIMNTHSRCADGRREVLVSHAALAGATPQVLRTLMDCSTTDDALDILKEAQLDEIVLAHIMQAIQENLQRRANDVPIEAIMFSKVHGLLGHTPGALALAQRIRQQQAQTKKGEE